MEVIDDLVAEQDLIASILAPLSPSEWDTPSLCEGWSVGDVLLHLAQTQEMAALTVGRPVTERTIAGESRGVDAAAAKAVVGERNTGAAVLDRWQRSCADFERAYRDADPASLVQWVGGTLKPATLATTRLAEHWAHGLDIATPLEAPYPDTDRLRHIAWLGHRTLPYSFTIAGQEPHPVYCELSSPTSGSIWTFGPADAPSSVRGPAAAFCRVGAQRLTPAASGLVASGPFADAALAVLRNYAS